MKTCFILLLFLIVTIADVSFGCSRTESGVPVCANYTRADAVFSGKVLKVEDVPKTEDYPPGGHKIRFQVLQNFKGADNPTFSLITADWKAAGGLNVKTGQTWIIYARNDIVVKSFQDFRGIRLEPKETSAELETLKNIFAGKSATAISGRLTSQNGKYTDEAVEIKIEGKNYKQTTKTDADGFFDFAVPAAGKYKVEIKFPFAANLVWDEGLLGTAYTADNPTFFKYDVSLGDGDCVYSFFEVSRK
ncbi:MAG: hypothetical protein ABJA66_05305 [Actinomycetota bacterium]